MKCDERYVGEKYVSKVGEIAWVAHTESKFIRKTPKKKKSTTIHIGIMRLEQIRKQIMDVTKYIYIYVVFFFILSHETSLKPKPNHCVCACFVIMRTVLATR